MRRWSSRIAPLTIGVALWAALPSLEWCPLAWPFCPTVAMAAPAGPRSEPPEVHHPVDGCDSPANCPLSKGAASSCSGSSCPAAAQAVARSAATPPPRAGEPVAPAPPGSGAWCVHPPVDGVVTRAHAAPKVVPSPPAMLAGALSVPVPAPARPARPQRRVAPPALAEPHAPPQSRAPPVGLPLDVL